MQLASGNKPTCSGQRRERERPFLVPRRLNSCVAAYYVASRIIVLSAKHVAVYAGPYGRYMFVLNSWTAAPVDGESLTHIPVSTAFHFADESRLYLPGFAGDVAGHCLLVDGLDLIFWQGATFASNVNLCVILPHVVLLNGVGEGINVQGARPSVDGGNGADNGRVASQPPPL